MLELVKHVGEIKDKIQVAKVKAFIATMQLAESFAKRNSTKQFTGRWGRTLTGNLLNNIYVSYKIQGDKMIGELGVRTIPYAAIHEFGGTIKPKNANRLWQPIYENSGKMTPREFMSLRESNKNQYAFFGNAAGKILNPVRGEEEPVNFLPLFALRKEVKIPERPYLRPALQEASLHYDEYLAKFLG
jgi:phage gpG-like protein